MLRLTKMIFKHDFGTKLPLNANSSRDEQFVQEELISRKAKQQSDKLHHVKGIKGFKLKYK